MARVNAAQLLARGVAGGDAGHFFREAGFLEAGDDRLVTLRAFGMAETGIVPEAKPVGGQAGHFRASHRAAASMSSCVIWWPLGTECPVTEAPAASSSSPRRAV